MGDNMNKFLPHIYETSIYTVDYNRLYNNNIKVVLFDLDNTIIPANETLITDEIKELFSNIKKLGLKPIIFSNSPKRRIKKVADILDIDFVYLAFKPLSFKFKRLIKKLNLKPSNVAIIGDQLLTDIKGGNKVGIKTILINPISDYDSFLTKFNRVKEKKILSKLDINRSYYEEM